jgi:hypothetical protein
MIQNMLWSKRIIFLTGIGLVIGLMSASVTRAETITVSSCEADDLIAAINTANASPEDDVIELEGTCTYILTVVHHRGNFGDDGLPDIANVETAGTLTLNGNGAIIQRSSAEDTLEFRFFEVTEGGDLTLNDLTFQNGMTRDAAAIRNSGVLTISDSVISGNFAEVRGGGIWNEARLTIGNSLISGNTAKGKFSGSGGGIWNSGEITLTDSVISGNSAEDGGGIYNGTGGKLTIENSTLADNSAESGGGIKNFEGELTLIGSTLSGNSATEGFGGGGISSNGDDARVTIQSSTLSGNSADDGGLYGTET